jgi:hypothetical protein
MFSKELHAQELKRYCLWDASFYVIVKVRVNRIKSKVENKEKLFFFLSPVIVSVFSCFVLRLDI